MLMQDNVNPKLQDFYHLPLREAAKAMGVCPTSLKRQCRREGVGRWPYRKLKSINQQIEELQAQMGQRNHQRDKHQKKLAVLLATKDAIFEPPTDAATESDLIQRRAQEYLTRVSDQIIWHNSEVDNTGKLTEVCAIPDFSSHEARSPTLSPPPSEENTMARSAPSESPLGNSKSTTPPPPPMSPQRLPPLRSILQEHLIPRHLSTPTRSETPQSPSRRDLFTPSPDPFFVNRR